jgi:DNA invertase Pin-like site-specific DNA recombinase
MCEENCVAFESVSEPIGGRFGKVFLAILGSLAELESQMKSDRQRLLRDSIEPGSDRFLGGYRPFGYDQVGTEKTTGWSLAGTRPMLSRRLPRRS